MTTKMKSDKRKKTYNNKEKYPRLSHEPATFPRADQMTIKKCTSDGV